MKKNNIVILRIIFTLAIIVYHYNFYTYNFVVVEGFFCISGYLIMAEAMKEKPPTIVKYIKKRFLRLYPYYILTWVIYFVVENIKWESSVLEIAHNVVTSLPQILCIQTMGMSGGHLYNECGWYVSSLLVGSIVVYAAVRLMKYKYIFIGMPLAVAVYYYFFTGPYQTINVYATSHMYIISEGLMRGIAGLTVGVFVYWLEKLLEEIITRDYIKYMGTYFFMILAFYYSCADKITWHSICEAKAMICLFISVMFGFLPLNIDFRKNRVIASLEKNSYYFYLNQAVFLWVIFREWAWIDGVTVKFGIFYVTVVIVYTYVLNYIISMTKELWKKLFVVNE